MRRDFNTLTEILNFSETRVFPPIDEYAETLLEISDIFLPDPYGIYAVNTGNCIINFEKTEGFWIDKSNGERRVIYDEQSFSEARGAIYNQDGNLILTPLAKHRLSFATQRPDFFKARKLAKAIVAETIDKEHDHVTVMPCVERDTESLVIEDVFRESPRCLRVYRKLVCNIADDLSEMLNKYEWNDIWILHSRGAFVIEVKVDKRIREWYEERFRKEIITQEEEREGMGMNSFFR